MQTFILRTLKVSISYLHSKFINVYTYTSYSLVNTHLLYTETVKNLAHCPRFKNLVVCFKKWYLHILEQCVNFANIQGLILKNDILNLTVVFIG